MERKPPKVSPKPLRERSSSVGVGLLKTFGIPKAALSGGGWKASAVDFHEKIAREVGRLFAKMDDPTKAQEAADVLERAKLPSNRARMTQESFKKKTELLVGLLQRMDPEKVSLQPPPPAQ